MRKLTDLEQIAAMVACSTLIVKGGRSHVLRTAGRIRFATLFPNGYSVIIPEAGHNVQEDVPVALALELRALIRRGRDQWPQS